MIRQNFISANIPVSDPSQIQRSHETCKYKEFT